MMIIIQNLKKKHTVTCTPGYWKIGNIYRAFPVNKDKMFMSHSIENKLFGTIVSYCERIFLHLDMFVLCKVNCNKTVIFHVDQHSNCRCPKCNTRSWHGVKDNHNVTLAYVLGFFTFGFT